MGNQVKREELFNWVESFHYKPNLVKAAYKAVSTGMLDYWTLEFDTGDTVFIYGYPDEEFGLQFNGTVSVDKPNDYPQSYDGMVHRVEGIIRDAYWRGLHND